MLKHEVGPLIPAEVKSHRFLELDSLRGLAALFVVFDHFTSLWANSRWVLWLNITPARLFIGGYEAVVFFFILSGFVLCVPYNSKNGSPPYPAYLLQRLCRIYVPFAVAIIIASLLDRVLYSTVPTGNAWIDQTWSVKPTMGMLFSVLATGSKYATQLHTAIWTIILEIRVSLIFPIIYFVAKRLKVLYTLCAIVIIPLALRLYGVPAAKLAVVITIGLFAMGVILFSHLDQVLQYFKGLSKPQQWLWLIVSSVLCWGPMMIMSALTNELILRGVQDYVIGVGAAGIIVAAIGSSTLRGILRHPLLLRFGALSYSIYLIHATVLWVIIRVLLGHLPTWSLLPIFLGSVWAAAEIFHLAIDAPSVLLGRMAGKFARRRLAGRAAEPLLLK
jgi:peptidoglycan/LPS O-acetylase OafA/YrhL